MLSDPTVLVLMYFLLPVWLIAGFADWLCHRASHIESTTGAKESLIHLLMFAEVGVPLLAAMFLDVNALIIAVMIVSFFIHEATAMWDVRYATTARTVMPIEQHVHSFLEMIDPADGAGQRRFPPLGTVPCAVRGRSGNRALRHCLEITAAAGDLKRSPLKIFSRSERSSYTEHLCRTSH
ncbi:hypothetical protein [Mesorhizobium sp. dw_380]|uniref:hypothetical protein n=1 Tax=Mesorhizobium sp. dw_380 TaxID=2812001 RepID=UPI0020329CC8|nr:hypothetical protein [Mesorhizobium sp. dw_380]